MPPNHAAIIGAIQLAAPIAHATHFDEVNRCVEVSVAAADVLRHFGMNAAAIPCVLHASNPSTGTLVTVGLSVMERRNMFPHATHVDADDGMSEGLHAVVRVRGTTAAILDLTIGQIRQYGVPTTLTAAYKPDRWQEWDVEDWTLWHTDSPRHESLTAYMEGLRFPGLSADLRDLTLAAINAGLDYNTFAYQIGLHLPDREFIRARIRRWAGIA